MDSVTAAMLFFECGMVVSALVTFGIVANPPTLDKVHPYWRFVFVASCVTLLMCVGFVVTSCMQ